MQVGKEENKKRSPRRGFTEDQIIGVELVRFLAETISEKY